MFQLRSVQKLCGCHRYVTYCNLIRKRHLEQTYNVYSISRKYCSRIDGNNESENPFDSEFVSPIPELDWKFLADPSLKEHIRSNIENRKGVGDIDKVHTLWQKYKEHMSLNEAPHEGQFLDDTSAQFNVEDYLQSQEADLATLKKQLLEAGTEIPNLTHSDTPIGDESNARLIKTVGDKIEFNFKPAGVVQLGRDLDALRTEYVGETTGLRSYYFKGQFVQLQNALVRYTVDYLKTQGFELVYVPDLIHPSIIEGCGFKAKGERSQVYHLEPSKHGQVSLAGTGEMPLAAMHSREILSSEDLPKKYMAVSRCYRAEVSGLQQEGGIYRVHQFTKVEMFGLTASETGKESEELMQELLDLQIHLYSNLGLHFRVMEMPSHELGAPAYRKIDIETWMPYKQFWGEISSTSNCLDYQSRRLNIKYWSDMKETPTFVHTVNGTACAVPRLIMAIAENFQTQDGAIEIPTVLQPYMDQQTLISKPENPDRMEFIRLQTKKDMESNISKTKRKKMQKEKWKKHSA